MKLHAWNEIDILRFVQLKPVEEILSHFTNLTPINEKDGLYFEKLITANDPIIFEIQRYELNSDLGSEFRGEGETGYIMYIFRGKYKNLLEYLTKLVGYKLFKSKKYPYNPYWKVALIKRTHNNEYHGDTRFCNDLWTEHTQLDRFIRKYKK